MDGEGWTEATAASFRRGVVRAGRDEPKAVLQRVDEKEIGGGDL